MPELCGFFFFFFFFLLFFFFFLNRDAALQSAQQFPPEEGLWCIAPDTPALCQAYHTKRRTPRRISVAQLRKCYALICVMARSRQPQQSMVYHDKLWQTMCGAAPNRTASALSPRASHILLPAEGAHLTLRTSQEHRLALFLRAANLAGRGIFLHEIRGVVIKWLEKNMAAAKFRSLANHNGTKFVVSAN